MGRLYPCRMGKSEIFNDYRQYLLPFDENNISPAGKECRNLNIIDFFEAKARLDKNILQNGNGFLNIS